MKELEILEADKVKAVAEIPVKRETKLLDSQVLRPGLTLWEYNPVTKELKPAEYEQSSLRFGDTIAKYDENGERYLCEPEMQVRYRHKLKFNPNCQYIQALNLANAKRKLHIA